MIKKIVAASSNAHKIKEIQAIMSKFGMEVISRDEAGVPPLKSKRTERRSRKTHTKSQ